MQLTQEAFARARTYLKTQARDLDRCRFEYAFEHGPAQAVVDALAAYRNADGGFGRALEPDCRYEGSWPVATTVALALLHEVGVPAQTSSVEGGVAYLVAAYDAEHQMWPFSLPGMNAVPHGPWWHNNDEPDLHDGFALVNPLFAAVGCLHAYCDATPPDFLEAVTALAMTRLAAQPDAMEKHVWRDALFMQQHLPEPERGTALAKLQRAALAIVERDPAKWGSYCAGPLWCASAPASPLARTLREEVAAHLDFEIGRQDADGSWKPSWTWGGRYEDAWEAAREEWAGHLTVEMLQCLRAYGRIAGLPRREVC